MYDNCRNFRCCNTPDDNDSVIKPPFPKQYSVAMAYIPFQNNTDVYDEVIAVSNEDSFETAKLIAKQEGVLVGISSGAAYFAALELAKRPENKGKTIVALLPDSGDRYYSTPLFSD